VWQVWLLSRLRNLKIFGVGGYSHRHQLEEKKGIHLKSRRKTICRKRQRQRRGIMAVTKDKPFISSIVMSAAFFLFGNGPMAGAQNGTLFSQDTGGATQRTYPSERGEVQLGQLGVAGASLPKLELHPHLSILVSDVETTSEIKFSEVMDQLVKQGGDSSQTKFSLFHQWWDTAGQQVPRPGQGAGLGLGPHCDDESPPQDDPQQGGIDNFMALSTRNGFPYRCPRLEALEASSDPFTDESAEAGYSAIAFSNRFDLIGADVPDPKRSWRMLTPDCGEYRIVFARNSGKPKDSINNARSRLNRNFIVFEARVPNPEPANGVNGCRPILDFWHGLSDKSISASARGKLLHDFYLNGLPRYNVGPVVDIANYTFGTGQIRTNQQLHNDSPQQEHPFDWTLREFKAVVGSDGRLRIVPDTVKTSPGNALFRSKSVDPRVASLTLNIRAQIGRLLGAAGPAKGVGDINSIGFSISGTGENAFEGDEWDGDRVKLGDVSAAFLGDVNGTPNPKLSKSIQEALTAAGSNLTPTNIVNRIRTQTCAGCHHYSGNPHAGPDDLGGGAVWPDKTDGDAEHPRMNFTHVSEREDDLRPAIVGDRSRYAISSAAEVFLKFRKAFMKKALGLP
jgi:hypothetical protein